MHPSIHSTSNHGVTVVKGKEFIYTWSIHNFNNLSINDINLNSPAFSTELSESIIWFLSMKSSLDNPYVSIEFLATSPGKSDSKERAHLTISIIDHKGREKVTVQSSFIPAKFQENSGRKIFNFVEKNYISDSKNGLLLDGILTIKIKMFILDGVLYESKSSSLQKSKSCNCNLKTLFETKTLSDAILDVGTQKFEIHKCILAAQSKVFSAMFEHNMKEKNENTVMIEDIEPQVIEEMLQFIYCGKTEGFQNVSKLLIAADKYEIDDLKSICEDQLISDINAKNVGETLILADRYKADELKKRIIQFIIMHPNEINFEQFKKDVESHSPLLIDMLRSMM